MADEQLVPDYPVRLTIEEVEYLLDLHENRGPGLQITPAWQEAPMVYRLLSKLSVVRRELYQVVPEETGGEPPPRD
jgi:hypothetical protein